MTTRSVWRRVPGSSRLRVHADSGRSATSVYSLAGASDWRRELLDRLGALALGVVGSHRLAPAGPLPWPDAAGDELVDRLAGELPGLSVRGAVVPRQPGRARVSLLGHLAGNDVVVKLGDDRDGMAREARALDLLVRDPLPGIATPEVLAHGGITVGDDAAYIVTAAVSLSRQRPALDVPLRTFGRELAARLDGLPRAPDTPTTYVPVHGDLTPWNLRRTSHGLALFDWEDVGWGPPGSDEATYRAACDEVRPWWRRRGGGARRDGR